MQNDVKKKKEAFQQKLNKAQKKAMNDKYNKDMDGVYSASMEITADGQKFYDVDTALFSNDTQMTANTLPPAPPSNEEVHLSEIQTRPRNTNNIDL